MPLTKRGETNMRRRVLFVMIAVALICCVLGALVACESYKSTALEKVGDKNADVTSNGGLIVKQGGYLYFINGYTGYLTTKGSDNWFGNVVKGAIVRVTYHEDGTLGDDYVVVVPKSVMASSENVGFSIYGEYIYYVSPSAEEDRAGAVQTDTLQFMRTKIDGTDTEVILEIDDTSVKYKYTPTALFYYDSAASKLYAKDLTKKSIKTSDKGLLISEDVASVCFPKNETYSPAKGVTIEDYVFYTKNSEDAYDYGNTLYVASPSGDVNKEIVGATLDGDKKYNISIIASSSEAGKVTIYYTKTSYTGTSSSGSVVGTYAYRFENSNFAFNRTNEKLLTTETLSSVFALGYETGLVVYGSSTSTLVYGIDGVDDSCSGLNMSTLVAAVDGTYYYLDGDNLLLAFDMDNASNARYAYTTGEKVMTSFAGVEYLDGYLYFIVDDEYDYVYRLNLSTISVTDPDSVSFERIGILTEADETKMKEAEEKDED